VSSPLLHTDGSSVVIFSGQNLGVIGSSYCSMSATYVGTSGVTQFSTCQPYSYNGTLMICTTSVGTDINHKWKFTIGGATYTGLSATTSYFPPVINSIIPSSGFNTAGGETFGVFGSEFGNNMTASFIVTIQLPAEFGGAVTRTCTLITAYTTLSCTNTPPGVGGPWPMTITTSYHTSSPAFVYQYLPPTVTSITPQSTVNITTDGSTKFTVTGTNFGRYLNALSIYLYFGSTTAQYNLEYATNCNITADVRM
jgi:hypothetical protein